MAPSKASTLSLFTIITLLLLLLLPLLSHAASSFEYLNQVKGCRKGDNVQGILDVKKHLEKFGYLSGYSQNDDFDDQLEMAIKTYQINYNLEATGRLDVKTVSNMMIPRCCVPDIINGTISMISRKIQHHEGLTVSQYSFFSGNPKWPSSKYRLTYAFLQGTPNQAKDPVKRAFQSWANNTQFTFSQVEAYETPDLTISFQRLDHGDGYPFDGRGGVTAHAFSPTDGRFHYDADEMWVVGSVNGGMDLQSIAVHEIGHLLGLNHSSVEEAIMYPFLNTATVKRNLMKPDDIQGIKNLYNIK